MLIDRLDLTPAVLFMPRDRRFHLPASELRLQAIVNSWTTVFPDSIESAVIDREDWIENAIRLHAALQQAPNTLAILDPDTGVARYVMDDRPVPETHPIVFLGAWLSNSMINSLSDLAVGTYCNVLNMSRGNLMLANGYAASSVFQKHVGRTFEICGVAETYLDRSRVRHDLYDQLIAMAENGEREVFIKVNRPKYLTTPVDLPDKVNRTTIRDALMAQGKDHLLLAAMHLAGVPNAFLVQSRIQMHREYRVIVVNHQPVAGAGCIETCTPVDNGGTWDAKMEDRRGDGVVKEQPGTLELYQAFARQFTADYALERPVCKNYTLDLALNDAGEVLVIEINPMLNYGLYAMDYAAILKAELDCHALSQHLQRAPVCTSAATRIGKPRP